MRVQPVKTPLFKTGQSLPEFLFRHLPRLNNGTIVVVTSKIVAIAEGRIAECRTEQQRTRLIKQESQWAMKTKLTWLTIKDGQALASAGIDQSNANGRCILLPADSYRSAVTIRLALMRRFRLQRLGVIISDSRILPLRQGITGVAVGYAGFRGLRDYRGTPDLFGRKLKMSVTNVADSLATAAVVTMGEGNERRPLAVINDAPVVFTDTLNRNELDIDPEDDMYRPLFERVRIPRITKLRPRSLST